MDIKQIKKYLKEPDEFYLKGDEVVLLDGRPSGKLYKETSFIYVDKMMSINAMEICNKRWMQEWKDKSDDLITIREKLHFKLHLNYEISVENNFFPELYFQPDFLSFLGRVGVEFSFYFYLD